MPWILISFASVKSCSFGCLNCHWKVAAVASLAFIIFALNLCLISPAISTHLETELKLWRTREEEEFFVCFRIFFFFWKEISYVFCSLLIHLCVWQSFSLREFNLKKLFFHEKVSLFFFILIPHLLRSFPLPLLASRLWLMLLMLEGKFYRKKIYFRLSECPLNAFFWKTFYSSISCSNTKECLEWMNEWRSLKSEGGTFFKKKKKI